MRAAGGSCSRLAGQPRSALSCFPGPRRRRPCRHAGACPWRRPPAPAAPRPADLYPVPPDCSLDNGFDLPAFQGRWYITGEGPEPPLTGCCVHAWPCPPHHSCLWQSCPCNPARLHVPAHAAGPPHLRPECLAPAAVWPHPNGLDLPPVKTLPRPAAGLNPLFDTFDCQEHFFASPEPGRVFAKINWRIPSSDPLTGDEDFIERSVTQRFVQVSAGRRGPWRDTQASAHHPIPGCCSSEEGLWLSAASSPGPGLCCPTKGPPHLPTDAADQRSPARPRAFLPSPPGPCDPRGAGQQGQRVPQLPGHVVSALDSCTRAHGLCTSLRTHGCARCGRGSAVAPLRALWVLALCALRARLMGMAEGRGGSAALQAHICALLLHAPTGPGRLVWLLRG